MRKPARAQLQGQEFGDLTVAEFHSIRGRAAIWRCICVCGGETLASTSALRRGERVGCGCSRKESKTAFGKRRCDPASDLDEMHRQLEEGLI